MPIAVSAILLVLAILAYLRHIRKAGWLLVLRLAVILLFAAILTDWVINYEWSKGSTRVVMLVDRSQSMGAVGADTLALKAAEVFQLPTGIRHEYWVFGDSTERVRSRVLESWNPGILESSFAARTRLGAALSKVIKTRPGAIVVFSDGQDNGEIDPVALARKAGMPVYTVGCGPVGKRNIDVTRISVPAMVYEGDTADIVGRVRYCGFGHGRAVVRLNGMRRELEIGPGPAEQEVSFRVVFKQSGQRLVRLVVESLPGENNYLDNRQEALVDVCPSRVRVAYVTNRPGFGSRFLHLALVQEPRIKLDKFIWLADNQGPITGKADVFVLAGISETKAMVWNEIAQKVQKGAGLLMLAGPDFRPGKVLKQLLPGGADVRPRSGSFIPALTSAAQMFSWLGDIDYDELPPFEWVYEPLGVFGNQVWLNARNSDVPLVFAYHAGKGKVVYVAGYPIWRWGFRPGIGPGKRGPLEIFLAGTIRYLAEKQGRRFRLEVNKPMFYPGESVRFLMNAKGPDGSPWSGLDVVLAIDSGPSSVPMIERADGVYEAVLPATGKRNHVCSALVRMGDSVLGRVRTSFAVAEREMELVRTGLDGGLLMAIARASGGGFFRWDSLPGQGFEPILAKSRRRFRFEPRRSVWVYVILALLVGLELVLRRRRGLL